MVKCKWCGKKFEAKRHDQKFCSKDCSYFYNVEKHNLISYIKKLAKKYQFDIGNIDFIVERKMSTFCQDDVKKCPHDIDNPDRFCGSARCIADTVYQGYCKAGLFWSKKPPLLKEKENPQSK